VRNTRCRPASARRPGFQREPQRQTRGDGIVPLRRRWRVESDGHSWEDALAAMATCGREDDVGEEKDEEGER
jgi:hypothetical protein